MVPAATNGLYDSRFEHDACGVGFVADLRARGGHDVVASALRVLCNLEHRGAAGADPDTGDGAGILTQIPDAFFRAVTGFALPEAGSYAVGLAFLSTDPAERERAFARIADLAADEGLTVLGWRDVPVNEAACGAGALEALPHLAQLFVAGEAGESGLVLDRMAFCLRKRAEHETGVYFASLSSRTIVYKGMLSAPQVEPFFPDLSDERYASNLALVHSRFSTNTFPSWPQVAPVPLRRAQRRDQHRAGQQELDARPRGDARLPADPGVEVGQGHRAAVPDHRPGRLGLRVVRRVPRTAAPRRPVAAARAAHDDPRAVGEP